MSDTGRGRPAIQDRGFPGCLLRAAGETVSHTGAPPIPEVRRLQGFATAHLSAFSPTAADHPAQTSSG